LNQATSVSDADRNRAYMLAERAFLNADGLPRRPFFKHSIYAPGEYTGYAAVVIPGVNEAIDGNDAVVTAKELAAVTAAIQRAADVLKAPTHH
jgi:N-acetylated-alpha-linked acidic dipeptidase